MSNFFKKDIGIIFILIVLFFAVLPFFYSNQGLLLIDTGREFYIPQQMLDRNILYKDIFNIYGALSYQINAFLYIIFGEKLNTLYNAGILNSFIIVVTIFLLSREFLSKGFSFLISTTIMFSLVFNVFLYNSNIPYAYAISYALSSFLISVLCLIKYVKTENNKMAYLSCLFCGVSLSNKYEFTLLPLILIYVLGFLKPIGIKNGIKALGCFFLVPIISYGSLLIQGLNILDIKETIKLLQNLVSAPILKIFFEKFGVFFNIDEIIKQTIINGYYAIFGFLPLICCCLFGIYIKETYQDKATFVFLLCAITACAKTFFFLNINHMGAFILPVIFIATIILINKLIKQKPIIYTILCSCILLFLSNDISLLKSKNFYLFTDKGSVKTFAKDGKPIKYAINYITSNTNKTDKIVVLPEGSIINFITDRKGDNFYYNLSPLFYYDVFGEKRILNHFNQNPPEYFVLLPINNIEYGSEFFGKDYAQNFYEMIINNYDIVEEQFNTKIFKRKNI